MCGVSARKVPHQNQWQKEQMANECVTMKVPKIKMEEDCSVINGQRITPESLGDISDILARMNRYYGRMYLGKRGTDAKKNKKT